MIPFCAGYINPAALGTSERERKITYAYAVPAPLLGTAINACKQLAELYGGFAASRVKANCEEHIVFAYECMAAHQALVAEQLEALEPVKVELA